jgi:hypothetical protein
LQKEKSEGKRREIQGQLTRLQQQLNDEKVRRKSKQLEQEWKVRAGARGWGLGTTLKLRQL